MKIIARKPCDDEGTEYIIVDRSIDHSQIQHFHPFVVATATKESLEREEWFYGHYFKTLHEALDFFDSLKYYKW